MKRLDLIQKEIENHFKVLEAVARELENIELDKDEFSINDLKTIDTFIFRFLKLQSAMGEKLFPLFFEYLTGKSHTDVVFLDILNTFEKYGILDADEWKEIRKLRNAFTHIYPWETEERIKLIKLALKKLEVIKQIYSKIKGLIKNEDKKVRLKDFEIEAIIKLAEEFFGKDSEVWIFGSRADLNAKGGDIDIYIEVENLPENYVERKINYLTKLTDLIGEQKVDLIVRDKYKQDFISKEAKKTGVKIK